MTSNIINYLNYEETKRHNLATENFNYVALGETRRHNIASERIGMAGVSAQFAAIAETSRHNQETEAQTWAKIPYETYQMTVKSGEAAANTDWINAKIAETESQTAFNTVKSFSTVGDMVIDVIKTGLLIFG